MIEFEKTLKALRDEERSTIISKQESDTQLKESARLRDEKQEREYTEKVFSAHVLFREDIHPILEAFNSNYLNDNKKNLKNNSFIFLGDREQWTDGWNSTGTLKSLLYDNWPHEGFEWDCEKGEGTHNLSFCLIGTRISITLGNNGSIDFNKISHEDFSKLDFKNDLQIDTFQEGWKKDLERKILKITSIPEITHEQVYVGSDINDK